MSWFEISCSVARPQGSMTISYSWHYTVLVTLSQARYSEQNETLDVWGQPRRHGSSSEILMKWEGGLVEGGYGMEG